MGKTHKILHCEKCTYTNFSKGIDNKMKKCYP